VRATVLAILASLALVGMTPSRLLVHGALKSSIPSAAAHLGEVPRALRLTFTETPELEFTRIQLLGPDSALVTLGPLRLDSARTVTADIRGPLVAGTYTVVWQVAGADGHPVRGRYSFTIAPGARGLAAERTPGEPAGNVTAPRQGSSPAQHHNGLSMPQGDGFGAESPLYVAIRWLNYTALLVVIGAAAFYWVVVGILRRRAPAERTAALVKLAATRSASLGAIAAIALAVTAVARLLAQSYAMHGGAGTLHGALVGAMLSRTVWGWGWLLQLIGVHVVVSGFVLARRGSAGGWTLAALGAVVLAFTPALSGHAASAPRLTGLAVVSDGLHVLGAGGWLGSLLVTIGVGVPAALTLDEAERGGAVADLINAYSPTALAFAALVGVTGAVAGWIHVGSFTALWQSTYGRTLLVKLAVLSVVAATGAYNWRRVRPALGDVDGARRVRRSASVELAVGAVVLIVTAILVATPTPMDMAAMTQ
jgi:copper resistance protein D